MSSELARRMDINMTKDLIFLIFAFLAVVYIFTFIKWRKRKKSNSISAIDEFKKKYVDRPKREDYLNNVLYDSAEGAEEYERIDYIEKDEFINQIKAELNNSNLNSGEQKKYELHF